MKYGLYAAASGRSPTDRIGAPTRTDWSSNFSGFHSRFGASAAGLSASEGLSAGLSASPSASLLPDDFLEVDALARTNARLVRSSRPRNSASSSSGSFSWLGIRIL